SAHGPFAGQTPGATALSLQNFLLLRAAPVYLVAILSEQRKASENSLRESEERFRKVANAAPVLIWMSGPDKSCTFLNQIWLDFTGRSIADGLGEGWAESVHPEDLPHLLGVYVSAFESRYPFEMEYRLRRRNGEYRWMLANGVPWYGPNGEFAGYL